jgi:NAD(P)-dependent dehydrogenase (short-subunit alcohol dehydrogenase family)
MTTMNGKVVIVTGAGSGIGRAEALAFARRGASVLVNDLGTGRDGEGSDPTRAMAVVEEIHKAGFTAAASFDSVATPQGAQRIVETALTTYGRVDVLVNNAGFVSDKSVLKLEPSMWEDVLRVHLTGTLLCSQAAARQFLKQGEGGRIVNTISASAFLGNFGQANVSAAKAGVYGLTRTFSIELQKHRITVNAIAPIAKTRLTEDLPMFHNVDTLSPEHVAPAAVYLGSDLAGDRTGHVLAVAGARMYAFKMIETAGRFKEADEGLWTPEQIAEHWDSIVKG